MFINKTLFAVSVCLYTFILSACRSAYHSVRLHHSFHAFFAETLSLVETCNDCIAAGDVKDDACCHGDAGRHAVNSRHVRRTQQPQRRNSGEEHDADLNGSEGEGMLKTGKAEIR